MNISRKQIKNRLTPFQIIVLFYLGAIVVSTGLLSIPILHRPGVELSWIDAFFTAVSAVSVTGLTVVSTAETFNGYGAMVLAFVLQFGGIGIMTLGTFIWLILGKRIGVSERRLIMIDQNRGTFSGLVQLMKQILILILTIEAIGALIFSVYFLKYFPTWQESLLQGIFASVSATTNAGFDITGESLVPFANDYFVQLLNIILLILGAIGFPVLIEIKEYFYHRSKRLSYRFSLFTKLTTITFFTLALLGTVFILVIEYKQFFLDKTWHESFFYALFQSVTTRNGGLSTMDVSEFTVPTQLILSGLMFIGASPSSVGGGIRTTTFVIALLAIYTFARGRQTIKVFKRQIDSEDVTKSFVVFSFAVLIVGSGIILLSLIEPFPLTAIVFEVCSAFGTTGLSMGITPELSSLGKIIIIMLMFIGRIGILSLLFTIRGKVMKKDYYQYPTERVIIG